MKCFEQIQSFPTPVLYQIIVSGVVNISISSNGAVVVADATDLNFQYGFAVATGSPGQGNVNVSLGTGSATMVSDYEVTTSIASIGLTFGLAAAGKYLVTISAPLLAANSAGSTTNVLLSIYNETTEEFIPNSERLAISYATQDVVFGFSPDFSFIVTLTEPSTLDVMAVETYNDGGYCVLYGGITTVHWTRIA